MTFLLLYPCVFFAAIFLIILYKRGFDASAYVTALYLIVGICNAIAYETLPANYGGNYFLHSRFSVESSIVYCGLIGLTIFPIYKLNTKNINFKNFKADKITRFLTYACIIALVFKLILNYKQIMFILTYGDFDKLKNQIYAGVKLADSGAGGSILGLISKPFNLISSVSFVMLPLFFISLITTKTTFKYKLLMLLASTNQIVVAILNVDRAAFAAWLMYFGLNLVIFWPHLSKSIKKQINPILSSLVLVVVIYLASVTISRFERSDYGTGGGILAYAGQSYTNFCYLFDNYDNKSGFNGMFFLTAYHEFVTKDYDGHLPYLIKMSFKSDYQVTIFYTFLGSFLVDNNQVGPFVFVALYLYLFYLALIKKRGRRMSLKNFIFCYCLMIIPTYGIIAYPYTTGLGQLGFILLIILFNLKIFNPEKSLSKRKAFVLPKR